MVTVYVSSAFQLCNTKFTTDLGMMMVAEIATDKCASGGC